MNQHRFTIDGSPALETQLASLCEAAREELFTVVPSSRVEALLLGGGYGRGEGGVLVTSQGEAPYNDLEFYLFLKGVPLLSERRYGRAVHEVAEQLTATAGIEVEFKILSLEKLRREPVSMFYYDLIMGHRWIYGDESCLAGCDHHRSAHRIPMHEATRLLMNRCSGLLFAAERLQRRHFGTGESDFVGRNMAKAKLALGDVVLAARGQYHWSCLERHKRLTKLDESTRVPHLDELITLHEQGVDFKLHPERMNKTREEFMPEFEFLRDAAREVWLWLENGRLGLSFRRPQDYALDPGNKCPEKSGWKNRLINARAFGKTAIFSNRYPRERLLNSLPLLLWMPETFSDSDLRQHICSELRISTTADFSAMVRAYESIWKRFN